MRDSKIYGLCAHDRFMYFAFRNTSIEDMIILNYKSQKYRVFKLIKAIILKPKMQCSAV